MFKHCPECGYKLEKDYKFCPECGCELKKIEQEKKDSENIPQEITPQETSPEKIIDFPVDFIKILAAPKICPTGLKRKVKSGKSV